MTDETHIVRADERFVTFAGGGFGTIEIERSTGSESVPRSASGRGYLRGHLPGLYAESDFAMRLVGALEAVLDPLVAVLDNLPEHFDPSCAPRDVLDLLTQWLGLEHDEGRSGEERRRLIQRAPELMRYRGTRAGVELALELAFPGVPFRIEDPGAVTWSLGQPQSWSEESPSFVIYCEVPLPETRLAAVARLIDQVKPAHVSFRLRVRATAGGEDQG
jgi:phage tail-like protein